MPRFTSTHGVPQQNSRLRTFYARWLLPMLLLPMIPALVQAQLVYHFNNNNGNPYEEVIGYTGPGGPVGIPDTFNGFPVTTIETNAFSPYCCSPYAGGGAAYGGYITSVTLGTNITYIATSAFAGCSNLTSITIPENFNGNYFDIGNFAFQNCYSLTSITLPANNTVDLGTESFQASGLTNITISANVQAIGSDAFMACLHLTAINVDPQNSIYSSTNGVLFDYTKSTLLAHPAGLGGSYTIPYGVTKIGTDAFIYNYLLTAVYVPDTVTNIGYWGFEYCGSLQGVYFYGNEPAPNNDTSVFVGDNTTVYYWTNASGWTFTFDGRPTTPWNPYPFTYTTNGGIVTITSYTGPYGPVTIPSRILGYPVTTIGSGSNTPSGFLNASSISIPSSVTEITNYAFNGCYNLTSITLTEGLDAIRSYAFKNCYNLTSITLPGSLGIIDSYAFEYCASLSKIAVPNSVWAIGNGAFEYCTSLTNATIGSGVYANTFGYQTFMGCNELTAINVDPNSRYYSSTNGVLFNKTQTTLIEYPGGLYPGGLFGSYTIPSGVTSIRADAFEMCGNLTYVDLPTELTSIGSSAFDSCGSLNEITIPDNVTNIGIYAFYNCSSLSSLTLGNGIPNIGGGVFELCSSLTSVTIPGSVNSIGNSAFEFCSSLTSVTLSSGVATIGHDAFADCAALADVTIPASVNNLGTYAFGGCGNLSFVLFLGNVLTPTNDTTVFSGAPFGIVYYLLGATGWPPTFDGLPTRLFNPSGSSFAFTAGSWRFQTNEFCFSITSTSNQVVVVEGCTNLADPNWIPLATNAVPAGFTNFCDPQLTNYPERFYRLASP